MTIGCGLYRDSFHPGTITSPKSALFTERNTIQLYALVLAFSTPALTPLLVLGSALATTSVLDAGYLWPCSMRRATSRA
jgi:hypothetical protein